MCPITFNEIRMLLWIQDHLRSPLMDEFMKLFSKIGNAGTVWIIICIGLLLYKSTRETGIRVAISLILSLIICNLILKNYVARIRPFDAYKYIDLIISKPTDFSFPSGHTSASFAAALTMFKSGIKIKGYKVGWIFIAIAVIISFSRLYLFVHYPSDVLGGVLTGMISYELAMWSYPHIRRIFKKSTI